MSQLSGTLTLLFVTMSLVDSGQRPKKEIWGRHLYIGMAKLNFSKILWQSINALMSKKFNNYTDFELTLKEQYVNNNNMCRIFSNFRLVNL